MSMNGAGNRLSLICFFLACFSLPSRAETFAGWAESKACSVPQIEVQAIDIQVPAVLLSQLEREHAKSREKEQQPSQKTARNLFSVFKLVRSIQPNTMEEKMADNTSNPSSKDWEKPGQKKPDQKKPDQNQDADQDSENP